MFLHIDSSLRNWVFFPITLITICVSLLMKYLTYIFNSGSNKIISSETKDIKSFDFKKGFKTRKAFFCKEETGFFSQKYEAKAADLMNPNMMGEMIKKNIVNAIYYIFIFVGVGFFFSGFILLKLPFGLTQKFRGMMQQGLNLPDVDVSYVSAISWCLILVFGLNNIIQFFDGGEDFSIMQQQEQMMKQPLNLMPNPMGGNDYDKVLKPEKESIAILPGFSVLDDAVDNVIEKYKSFL